MQATAASRGEQSRQACRGAACCRHSLRVTATVGQETLKSIGLLLRMVHRPGLAIGPAELPRSPRRTLWRRSSWFSRQIHRVGLTHVVSSLPVVRIFTLVGRHVTRTAAGTVVVAFSAPHIRPLIRTAFTAVELSKEHWYWFDDQWHYIEDDIIHFEDDPTMPAQLKAEGVLFIYKGTPTCFWPPQRRLAMFDADDPYIPPGKLFSSFSSSRWCACTPRTCRIHHRYPKGVVMTASILARRMGFDPRTIIVCNAIGCETVVTMSDAFAYPIVRQNEPSIGFFCTPRCFLRAIPPHGCGRSQ